jgi:hypothetical protein
MHVGNPFFKTFEMLKVIQIIFESDAGTSYQ